MFFSLDVIRARKGDCLILHYGSEDDPRLIMIDGGHKNVYGPHLRPRIERIRETRGLKPKQPLPVDLLMVSHVDEDHIQGILDLTKELITAAMEQEPPLVRVLSLWHNSFENIIGDTPDDLTAAFEGRFPTASTVGDWADDVTIKADDADLDEEMIMSNLKVFASIKQGAQLRSDAERLDFPLNPEFDGKLIQAKEHAEKIDMQKGLTFTVIGPMLSELKKLHAKHQAWLRELKKDGMTPDDVLSAYVDKSVPNLSSLVLLAEAGGKSMLLTGDARGDKILEALELLGLVEPGGEMKVDLLKVPHHGSANNLKDDFFQRITADHYVFSGNGENGNPERESLEMLLNARGTDGYTIHLTYPIEEIDVERKADWEKLQASERDKGKKVRPDWSPVEHGLEAFFSEHENLMKNVRIVEDNRPHVIDLLEKLDP